MDPEDDTNVNEEVSEDASADSSSADLSADPAQVLDQGAASEAIDNTQDISAADQQAGQDEKAPADKEDTTLTIVERILGIGKKDKKNNVDSTDADGSVVDAANVDNATATAGADDVSDGEDGKKATAAVEVPKEIAESEAYKALEAQNAQLVSSHEKIGALETFMTGANLTPDDMTGALSQAAARKASNISSDEYAQAEALTVLFHTDQNAFFDKITAMRNEVGVRLNKFLPGDLQDKVDNGDMSEDDARAFSSERIARQDADHRAANATNVATAVTTQSNAALNENTVGGWFDATSKTDPDLKYKVSAIEGEVLRLTAELSRNGQAGPSTDVEIAALLDKAHNNVTETMRATRPTKQPVDAAPRSNTAPGKNSELQNQTPKDKMVSDVQDIMNRNVG